MRMIPDDRHDEWSILLENWAEPYRLSPSETVSIRKRIVEPVSAADDGEWSRMFDYFPLFFAHNCIPAHVFRFAMNVELDEDVSFRPYVAIV